MHGRHGRPASVPREPRFALGQATVGPHCLEMQGKLSNQDRRSHTKCTSGRWLAVAGVSGSGAHSQKRSGAHRGETISAKLYLAL